MVELGLRWLAARYYYHAENYVIERPHWKSGWCAYRGMPAPAPAVHLGAWPSFRLAATACEIDRVLETG